jgi:Ca2+/Na+ antiporter
MCDFSSDVSKCDAELAWPTCLCDEFVKEIEKKSCEVSANPMQEVLHDITDSTKTPPQSTWHFESEDAKSACQASYMDDVMVTSNDGMGVLCTHAPQLLGIVLLLLLALWSFEGVLQIYVDYKSTTKYFDNAHKTTNVKWSEGVLFLVLLVVWMVVTFGASRQWADTLDMPQADNEWKYAHLHLNGEAMAWEDGHPRHLKRSIPWGSVCYFAVVILFWALSTLMGYTLDFQDKGGVPEEEMKGVGDPRGDLVYVDSSQDPPRHNPDPFPANPQNDDNGDEQSGWAQPYGAKSDPPAHSWNLQAFGLTPAVRPHYSVLITEDHAPAEITWDNTTMQQQNSTYKILFLLTAVMLCIVMHNSYVLDVMFWSIVFTVIAYGVLDVALRRTHELLGAATKVKGGNNENNTSWGSTGLLFLGTVIKLVIVAWGTWMLWQEKQMSPTFDAALRLEEVSSDPVSLELGVDEGLDFLGSDDNMFFLTIGLWVLIVLVDLFVDGKSRLHTHTSADQWTLVRGFVYAVMVVYSGIVFAALFYLPAGFDKYTTHVQSGSDPIFSAYEWQRNNWLHGVHA